MEKISRTEYNTLGEWNQAGNFNCNQPNKQKNKKHKKNVLTKHHKFNFIMLFTKYHT